MSYALSNGRSARRYHAGADGAVFADQIQVTDPEGWIELAAPPGSDVRRFALRLRVALDSHGAPALVAEEAVVAGRRFVGVPALINARGESWGPHVCDEVDREIERRVAGASARLGSTSPTVPAMRALSITMDVAPQPPRRASQPATGSRAEPPPFPIAPARTKTEYRVAPSGELLAQGVRVTDAAGWIDVRTLPTAVAAGAPPVLALRVVLAPDAAGRPGLAVVAVGVSGGVAVATLEAPWAAFFRATIAEALHAEIDRRIASAQRPTRSLRVSGRHSLPALAAPAAAHAPVEGEPRDPTSTR